MTTFQCPIVNADAVGQRCGYGEGKTWEEAQAKALAIALKQDPNAKFFANCVLISIGYSL